MSSNIVVDSFSVVSANLAATLLVIAPYAVAIVTIILGFLYGKKLFIMISTYQETKEDMRRSGW